MKKLIKLFLVLSIILLLFGCKKEEKQEKEEGINYPVQVILKGIKYKLDVEDTGYNIKYKVAKNFRKTVLSNAINYFSEKIDGQSYFVIRLFYYKNKDVNYAIKDTTTEYDNKYTKTINGIDYVVVHFKNSIGDAQTNIYYYTHNKDTYAFCFTSGIDIEILETKFLEMVEY